MARLSKQRKQRIQRRAQVEARRENAPAVGAARSVISQANRTYGREAADARGAQRTMVSQLNKMLSGVGDSGLRGKYAAQTVADLRGRKAEAVSGLPYALSQAQQRRTDAVSDARSSMADAQAAVQSAAGKKYNTYLADARKKKTERIESARSDKTSSNKDFRAAMIAAKGAWNTAVDKTVVDPVSGEVKQMGKDRIIANPDGFAIALAKNKGVNITEAKRAANALIRRYQRKAVKRTFRPWLGGK